MDVEAILWALELSARYGALETRPAVRLYSWRHPELGGARATGTCPVCELEVELLEDRLPVYVVLDRVGSRWQTRPAWTHRRECFAEEERRRAERLRSLGPVDLWERE